MRINLAALSLVAVVLFQTCAANNQQLDHDCTNTAMAKCSRAPKPYEAPGLEPWFNYCRCSYWSNSRLGCHTACVNDMKPELNGKDADATCNALQMKTTPARMHSTNDTIEKRHTTPYSPASSSFERSSSAPKSLQQAMRPNAAALALALVAVALWQPCAADRGKLDENCTNEAISKCSRAPKPYEAPGLEPWFNYCRCSYWSSFGLGCHTACVNDMKPELYGKDADATCNAYCNNCNEPPPCS
ncbi:hypothetical protein OC834_005282 [Tilletia horrida]|nr:hypothetical protein OC834_005282 [Tilletia horrida]